MQKTPQDRAGVGQGPADALTTLLLSGRDTLPHAANGESIPCSDPYAEQVRKDMARGRSQEFKRLRAVALCDRRDGVPASIVTAALRLLITEIEMEPVAPLRTDRPLPAVVRAETKAQARLDLAQLKVVESPTSVAVIEEALREASLYRSELDTFTASCERQLVVVRTQSRPVYGRFAVRSTPRLEVAR